MADVLEVVTLSARSSDSRFLTFPDMAKIMWSHTLVQRRQTRG